MKAITGPFVFLLTIALIVLYRIIECWQPTWRPAINQTCTMRIKSLFKALGLTIAALFYSLLEVAYQALRFLVKWFLVGIVVALASCIFVLMLPYSLFKCVVRAVSHRSFSAGGQLMKWIWKDFWKAAGL